VVPLNREHGTSNPFLSFATSAPARSSGAPYMNWQWSRLPDFTAMLLARTGASPCSDTVMHGCFGMGTLPAVSLVPSMSPSADTAGALPNPLMAVLHSGTSPNEKDPDNAGLPLPYDGLVLDGWPLPQLVVQLADSA